jgi:hypothetical protein
VCSRLSGNVTVMPVPVEPDARMRVIRLAFMMRHTRRARRVGSCPMRWVAIGTAAARIAHIITIRALSR